MRQIDLIVIHETFDNILWTLWHRWIHQTSLILYFTIDIASDRPNQPITKYPKYSMRKEEVKICGKVINIEKSFSVWLVMAKDLIIH